ncbi:MAG: serine/threonine protein phosphatase [Epulopiscium sp.]|nr:serine/threonine protein phosphatase [Candidatus Epulonipiscium sp.]
MDIYAIGDLHLSASVDKPMDIFGDNWQDHQEQIVKNWQDIVKDKDIVLIAGDISWAMSLEEAYMDLETIDKLPGYKILIKGNHDYWWQSINKLNSLYDNMFFLQNTSYKVGHYGICGSRGWGCPVDGQLDEHNSKIYKREGKRLELSLEHAMQAGCKEIIVMMHYPPTNDKKEDSLYTDLFKNYPVSQVVYGHLHGKESFNNSIRGIKENINYTLVSADAINFKPQKILSYNR